MTENEFLIMYEEKESELKFKKRKLNTTIETLRMLKVSLDSQANVLWKEQADVEGLDKLSVKNLFYKITSRMDNILQKEEQEYLDAKVKYEELQNSISIIEKDMKDLQNDIYYIENELTDLKESGRRQFAEIDKRITESENKVVQLKSEIKELDEAIESGIKVRKAIQRAIQKLKKARGWATYDMFSKGGIISHMAKYNNIDDAQDTIKEIGHLIDVFQSELKDVDITFHNSHDKYEGTTRFVDFFFDNIFTDMNVRGKIDSDISRLNDLDNEIESIQSRLVQSKETKLKDISGLI